jgi:uncharacterized protein (DUF433 family)
MNVQVNHYLELRQQGMSHDKALTHTIQRYGITIAALSQAIAEERRAREKALELLTNDGNPVEVVG